jgi:hypothetical protein
MTPVVVKPTLPLIRRFPSVITFVARLGGKAKLLIAEKEHSVVN